MKSVELFSGAGGLAKGLELSGFEHESFVEFNDHAYRSLASNFDKNKVFHGDIQQFDFSDLSGIDLVAGGPPCQPFSLGGKHKAHRDSRDMFPYAIRAISVLSPRAFIFENVKGLLRPSFTNYFEYIILRLTYPDLKQLESQSWEQHFQELKKIGPKNYTGIKYDVSYKLLNAADYGVPQARERVVIVGIRSDLGLCWTFPRPTHSEKRLLWEQNVSGEYWKKHHLRPSAKMCETHLVRNELFAPPLLPWQTVRDALRGVPEPNTAHGIPDHIFRDGARTYPGHTGSYVDWPAKTIKAGGHGVPGGENMLRYANGAVRYFSVYEAKLIQTFPSDFVVSGGWGEALRQIGNAVPVRLAKILGDSLFDLLCSSEEASLPTTAKRAI
jgi:DNA (cytosine-5)-methyltransferase 1